MNGVIQGMFIGVAPRPSGPAVQRTAALGPPRPAGRPPAGPPPHATAFPIDPGMVGLAAGAGAPLPDEVRGRMEVALGADFSGVRIHVGPQAARIGAIAFTLGSDIYFAPGRYQPQTTQGQLLLGHELAHVIQQRQGRVRNPMGSGVSVVRDPSLEREADRLGQRALLDRRPPSSPLVPRRAPHWAAVAPRRAVVQRMDAPPDPLEEMCAALLAAREARGADLADKPRWPELNAIPFGRGTSLADSFKTAGVRTLGDIKALVERSAAFARRRPRMLELALAAAEHDAAAEAARLADIDFRRMETVARFLETPTNVCVAIAVVGDEIVASTNEGPIASIAFVAGADGEAGRLRVNAAYRPEREEQLADVSARKLSAYVGADARRVMLLNSVRQIGAAWPTDIHAEMKMLEFLVRSRVTGEVTVYISRLCCPKCRKAIECWNVAAKQPRITVRAGTHGSAYPGWRAPNCIADDEDLSRAIAGEGPPTGAARGRPRWREFSDRADTNILSNRRARSESPAPKGPRNYELV